MRHSLKTVMHRTLTAVELGYRIVRGIDYQTLSQYILKINKHREIDAVLYEVSHCLKDILDYELFGFALKSGDTMDLWIDPRMYGQSFSDYVMREYGCQNADCCIHNLEKTPGVSRHNPDAVDLDNLISFKVIDGAHSARMYILPRKKMLRYHTTIIGTIISSISIALEKNLSIQQLENDAAVDPLTKCYNRRALDTFMENDIAYARRHGQELSVIMFDLDDFKMINDVHGHPAGDAVLKAVSSRVHSLVRKSDYLARYGGEEFVLVLPDTTLNNAVRLADKLRQAIEHEAISTGDTSITATASFGVASLEKKAGGSALVREADDRLYRAKTTGKNRVVPVLAPCISDKGFKSSKPAGRCGGIVQMA